MPVIRSLMSRACQALCALALLHTLPAWAQDPATRSLQASGRASAQAGVSTLLGVSAVGNATLAVSTIPLAVGGSAMTTAGHASTAAAGGSQAGAAPIGQPLPITDEIITAMPPGVALRQPVTPAPATR